MVCLVALCDVFVCDVGVMCKGDVFGCVLCVRRVCSSASGCVLVLAL